MNTQPYCLPLVGQLNCRDLNQYTNQHGQKIRPNTLLRSGQLHTLTQQDIKTLSAINIKHIIDFRTTSETQSQPNLVISNTTHTQNLPINAGNINISNLKDLIIQADIAAIEQFFFHLYDELALNTISQYQAFFHALQELEDGALLFHCTAGKDRTGLATYLLLHALDFDQEIIMADYLFSNQNTTSTKQAILNLLPLQTSQQMQSLDCILSVQKNYLLHAIAQIEKQYLSINHFISNTLNVNIDHLKKQFLINA